MPPRPVRVASDDGSLPIAWPFVVTAVLVGLAFALGKFFGVASLARVARLDANLQALQHLLQTEARDAE